MKPFETRESQKEPPAKISFEQLRAQIAATLIGAQYGEDSPRADLMHGLARVDAIRFNDLLQTIAQLPPESQQIASVHLHEYQRAVAEISPEKAAGTEDVAEYAERYFRQWQARQGLTQQEARAQVLSGEFHPIIQKALELAVNALKRVLSPQEMTAAMRLASLLAVVSMLSGGIIATTETAQASSDEAGQTTQMTDADVEASDNDQEATPPKATPTPTRRPTPVPTATPEAESVAVVYDGVTTVDLNVRPATNTNGAPIGKLPIGTKFEIQEVNTEWGKLIATYDQNGKRIAYDEEAYISLNPQYVTLKEEARSITATPEPDVTPATGGAGVEAITDAEVLALAQETFGPNVVVDDNSGIFTARNLQGTELGRFQNGEWVITNPGAVEAATPVESSDEESAEVEAGDSETYVRSLYPADIEQYYEQKNLSVTYDTDLRLLVAKNSAGKKFPLLPYASASDPDKDSEMAETYFDPEQSCLTSTEVSEFNPEGITRKLCLFVSKQHPVIDGHMYIHPDLLKNQDAVLADLAEYVYTKGSERVNKNGFILYINMAADEANQYAPRDFEEVSSANGQNSKYEEWGINNISLPEDPKLRVTLIPGEEGKPDILILNMFQKIRGVQAHADRLDFLQHVLPYRPFSVGIEMLHNLTMRSDGMGSLRTLEAFSKKMNAHKTDKNATLGGSAAKPTYKTWYNQ